MEGDLNIPVIVTECLLYVTGLTIHSFVIGVNVTDWLKRRPLTTAEHIITSLFISKLLYHLFGLVDIIRSFFLEEISMAYAISSNLIANWSMVSSVCLSTLLSVVYCLKICHFHNPIIIHVKRIISSGIFPLITACVLVSAGYSSTSVLIILFTSTKESYKNETLEITSDTWEWEQLQELFFFIVIITIFLVPSAIVIITLCHHVCHMRTNSNLSNHLVAYFKTIKLTIVSFLSCLLCSVISLTGKSWINAIGSEWVYLLWNVLWILQSICLIWVTTRLRNQFSQIFQIGTNCFRKRRSSEPNNGAQIETISP